jgi:hypothetical protein
MSMPRDIQSGVPQNFVLSPTVYSIYIYIYIDTPRTPSVYLGLYADNTFIYATDRKEGYVLIKLQRGLSAAETWLALRNKNQWTYDSRHLLF